MARTIEQIQQAIIDAKTADATLNAQLTSTSAVAEWRLWTYIVAVCIHVLESLLDFFMADVDAKMATQRAHILQWYVGKAKAFQYGVSLPADSDVYAVVPPVDPTVLVVKHASATELPSGEVRIKVAKNVPLEPLSVTELAAFDAYMKRVKDAGVRLQLTTGNPDDVQVTIEVFYDPLVLDATGARLDATSATPVKDAIKEYLSGLPFNGLFVTTELIAALREVEGVRIPDITLIQARYGMMPYATVAYEYTPDAGYMKLDESHFDANVTYTAHGPIV